MTSTSSQYDSERTAFSIGSRFERLPFTRYQKKLVAILALCFVVDAVDLQLLAYLLAPISQDLGLTPVQSGYAASSVFVGMAVGATVAGAVADRRGRRFVLVSSMIVWGAASLLTAFSWDLGSFVSFRILTGIGLGAELPVA
jgi:putative MFS transporter